ncbi:MAG: DUF3352 domain-containing protein [Trueperaceae bacterium]|nr:DUF3352 domain-containing protein [Truepera sp.]HRN17689.1 DUF3352 domain-containing protein [Trueperaceae bacterium]HRQ10784.1 DUF3352 domain-containing protein [Trueperaceae bacterium]
MLVAAAFLAAATAQSLAALLPSETLAAVGVQGLAQHKDQLQPFIDEWDRLGLTDLLEQSGGDAVGDEIPADLQGMNLFDVLGDEVWIGVSASSVSPVPAVTVVGRMSDKAAALLSSSLAEENAGSEVQTLTEGKIEFKVYTSDDDEMPVAMAQDGNFLAFSTNPDALRGVLRRYQGAKEPNFTDSKTYSSTLAAISPALVSFVIDLPAVVDVVMPFAKGMGFDQSAQRVANMLKTMGVFATTVRLTDAGVETLSLHALGDRSLDPALFDLLSNKTGYPSAVLSFVPDSAVGVQAGATDIPAIWAYLNQLVGQLPELGISDLDSFISDNLGLDLNLMLFGWMGPGTASITISSPAATQPGITPENLLGDSVYLVAVKDEAAAAAGLSQFLTMATSMGASFVAPDSDSGMVQPTTRQSSGVDVTSYAVGDGLTFETAFTDGYLLIATSSGAMDASLAAHASHRSGLAGALAPLQKNVPAGATTMALSNDQASLRTLADTLLSQLGLAAGMTGSEDLDFDAVEATGDALTQFVNFVADRLGGSYSYQVPDGNVIRGYGLLSVTW